MAEVPGGIARDGRLLRGVAVKLVDAGGGLGEIYVKTTRGAVNGRRDGAETENSTRVFRNESSGTLRSSGELRGALEPSGPDETAGNEFDLTAFGNFERVLGVPQNGVF